MWYTPRMDFRHPIQQIANRWMAKFRDDSLYASEASGRVVDIEALERYVNSAIAEMTEKGFQVYADGSNMQIAGVGMSYAETGNKINVEFIPID